MTVIAYNNVNFATPEQDAEDFEGLVREALREFPSDPVIVAMIEMRRRVEREQFHEHQPRQADGSVGSEGLFLDRKGLRVHSMFSKQAAFRTFGARIGPRKFVGTVVVPDLLPSRLAVIVVHMPPKRYWGPLYALYAMRLRALLGDLKRRGIPFIVVGDWNKYLRTDPAGLRAAFGGKWHGDMGDIDGFYVSPAAEKFVGKVWKKPHPNRGDSHPSWFMRIVKDPT